MTQLQQLIQTATADLPNVSTKAEVQNLIGSIFSKLTVNQIKHLNERVASCNKYKRLLEEKGTKTAAISIMVASNMKNRTGRQTRNICDICEGKHLVLK